MSGLNQKDIDILREYASKGNRELYWNYLAQTEGSDGYGLLALGVVRNDNLPGQVANAYAQSKASDQHDRDPRFQNRVLTEREWEDFGQTLLDRDLERREYWMGSRRPDLALNLPGRDVQVAHDKAFVEHGLDPNCWTPRILLEAARKNLSEDAAEDVWKQMLNNGMGGTARAWNTANHAFDAMPKVQAGAYVVKLGVYEMAMMDQALPAVDPNVIGVRSYHHIYDEKAGTWQRFTEGGVPMQERNARVIEGLNEAREVRLERQLKGTQFHEDDPYRQRIETPKVVLNDAPGQEQSTRIAGLKPGDEHYQLYQQIREHVAALDAKHGRSFDETSERLSTSLTALAVENKLDRADHVVFSQATTDAAAGRNIFVVQGDLGNPAHLRAAMPTEVAVQTPVEQSLQRLEVAGQDQQALAMQTEQRTQQDQREVEARSMRMG
ncbi:XVIPCD domain-containing protein [Stenotrophomonas sp.]|uniref:XVIPCD domain-containing protein n=1 Tax=Stenotrophomonas sp. TaxID=69392 RepID=UPI0028A9003A|nr:XVIPCD domain-containing protein [Stenotrophomonas sp.]